MKVLIYSGAFGRSGSSIRAEVMAKGFRAIGLDVALAGYDIPAELASAYRSYVFRGERHGQDDLTEAASDFRPHWIYGITYEVCNWLVKAAVQSGSRLAVDVHAISIFEIIELGRGYGNRIRRLQRGVAGLVELKKADLITVDPPTLCPALRRLYGASKVVQLTGMLDTDLFPRDGSKEPVSADKLRVYYIGNYYKWQGVGMYLDAAVRVLGRSDAFDFSILGSTGLPRGSRISSHPALRNGQVSVVGPVSHEEVPRFAYSADVLVLPRPRMLSTHFAFPSKLCEYMATGRAIVATDLGPHRWALRDPKCGVLCPPSERGIAQALLDLDMETALQYGENARRIALSRFDFLNQCALIRREFEARL